MKEYKVYFEGFKSIEAEDENEATDQIYEDLKEICCQFSITATKED